ncbi:MAG: hypothetical protein ACYTHM_24430 [Planctomycetota bacterium]|jgi:hypothetical protein
MSEDATGELSPANLKKALRAFKKRLKLQRLDQESGLAGGPCSSGRSSSIVAIRPPNQFSREVWDKLVEMGKLTTEGNGLYGLV